MAIKQEQIKLTMNELMVSIVDAQKAGIPCFNPDNVEFTFPLEEVGATLKVNLRFDWYQVTLPSAAAQTKQDWADAVKDIAAVAVKP
jgi:hypothetical protein